MFNLAARWLRSERAAGLVEQSLLSGTNLVTAILAARFLSKDDWGAYSLALASVLFAQGFQRAYVVIPMIAFSSMPEQFAGHASYWRNINRRVTVVGLGACGVVCALGYYTGSSFLAIVGASAAIMTGPAFTFEFLRRVAIQLRVGTILPTAATIYATFFLALLIVCVSVSPTAIAVVAANSVACMASALFIARRIRPNLSFKEGDLPSLNLPRYGLWASLAHVGYSAYNYAIQVILGYFHGASAVGAMNALRTIVQPVQTIIAAIDNFDKPRASRSHAAGGIVAMLRVLQGTLRVLLLLGGGYLLFTLIFGGDLLLLAYGDKYSSEVYALPLLAVVYLIMLIAQPVESAMYVLNRPGMLCLGRFLAGAIAASFALLIIPEMGITGAIIAVGTGWLCSSVFALIVIGLIYRKVT